MLQTNAGLDRIIFYNVYSTHQNTYTMCSKNSNVYTFFLATIFIPLQTGILIEEEYHYEYGCVVFA